MVTLRLSSLPWSSGRLGVQAGGRSFAGLSSAATLTLRYASIAQQHTYGPRGSRLAYTIWKGVAFGKSVGFKPPKGIQPLLLLPHFARSVASDLFNGRTMMSSSQTPGKEEPQSVLQANEPAVPPRPSDSPRVLAAACIIGNELLTGKVRDINTFVLSKILFENGVDLVRVEIIPDVVDDIADTVKTLSERVGPNGFVFTSGGIGPTHDDVTYEGVAKAFGVPLEIHQETVDKMRMYTKTEINEARLRMARLPRGCEVISTEETWVPLAKMTNVYILPGVPKFFKILMDAHRDRFMGYPMYRALVGTNKKEGEIAHILGEVQDNFPDLAIGSYPKVCESERFQVKVSIEGRSSGDVEAVAVHFEASLEGWREEGHDRPIDQ